MNEKELYEKLLKAFITSLLRTAKTGAGGRWPMPFFKNSNSLSFFSAPGIIQEFMEITDEMIKNGLSYKDIGKKYKYPSQLARIFHVFSSRSLWDMPPEKYLEVGFRVANILSTMYKENMFCKEGKYKAYKDSEITNNFCAISRENFVSEKFYSLTKKMKGVLWSLAEAMGPRFHNDFYEFSGPYEVENKFVIIKEFHNLRPDYLPNFFEHDFDNITILEIYDKKVSTYLDIMNRFSLEKGENNVPNIIFLKNGVVLKGDEIEKCFNAIMLSLGKAVNFLQKMTREEMIIFNASAERFTFLYPLIGKKALEIPESFYASLIDKQMEEKRQRLSDWFDSIKKTEEGWIKIYDLKNLEKVW